MNVRLRFFAAFREAVGQREMAWDVPANITVKALVADVLAKYPALVPLMQTSMVMVNQQYSEPDAVLRDGAEIAFIPPLGGGV